MSALLTTLRRRGFIKQCTDETALANRLAQGALCLYVGLDPTASSLHVGHLLPLMAALRLARSGQRLLLVLGGGTARIGDPSGKTETRTLLSPERIQANGQQIAGQLRQFCERLEVEPHILNNADWLDGLNYIEFLRDIGRYFSVNRMLSFETYRQRLENGLSFIEFNYQLLQSYDYLTLYRNYDCQLQIGGDDQWGNIVAGTDLVRRICRRKIFGLTVPLLVTADGRKMGKTERGVLSIDRRQTSVYDFFHYWRNVADADVPQLLNLLTLLPDEEVAGLTAPAADINQAKETLAFELTALVHGISEAQQARQAARAAFGKGAPQELAGLPLLELAASVLQSGIGAAALFAQSPLCKSLSEARRLIEQGGASINGQRLDDIALRIDESWLDNGALMLRAGKKRYCRVTLRSSDVVSPVDQ